MSDLDLTFDEATHTYRFRGEVVPNVTGVLASVMKWDWVPEDQREFARERGRALHAASLMIDDGTLDWDSVDEAVLPYAKGYLKFMSEYRPGWTLREHPVAHKQHRYAGTLDRFGWLERIRIPLQHYLVELKTGSMHPAYWLQLAAYKEALIDCDSSPEIRLADLAVVCLSNKGDYRIHYLPKDLTQSYCFSIFLSLLNVARWKQTNLV